jgi:hypothetical protein
VTASAFDGSQRLFHIGARPLDPEDWIDVDGRLAEYLSEKERLAATHPEAVFLAEAGTEAAQAELLGMLGEHLPSRFPAIYVRRGGAIEIVPAGRTVALDAPMTPPLMVAASLVQEDLVLMRRGEGDWRLDAASLSFPSSWRLREKFGKALDEMHAPVPGFGAGTRNAALIARMFDSMRPEMGMVRWNWSLYGDAALFHPEPEGEHDFAGGAFLRVERQTLRKLPASGDIVFTIRIYVDPLEAVTGRADGPRIAAGLLEQLMGLDDAQLRYKGMSKARDAMAERLRALAQNSSRCAPR